MTDGRNPIVELDALVCGYDDPLLGPLDMTVSRGVFVLIEGPNGIGKSTLIQTLVGLLDPLSGDYQWSVDPRSIRFVPQVRTLDPILPATVADVVATGTQQGGGLSGLRATADADAIRGALRRVEMTDVADHLFRELSEGQKQLVLLARALMGDADVLLLDEPTASMDPEREQRAFELLRRQMHSSDLTIFTVAHGSKHAHDAADKLLEIDHDRHVTINPISS